MHRVVAAVAAASIAAAALAQTVNDLKTRSETTPPAPEARAPEAPPASSRLHSQDPDADTPEAKTLPLPTGDANGDSECQVRRADTDTGFVVVCDERNG